MFYTYTKYITFILPFPLPSPIPPHVIIFVCRDGLGDVSPRSSIRDFHRLLRMWPLTGTQETSRGYIPKEYLLCPLQQLLAAHISCTKNWGLWFPDTHAGSIGLLELVLRSFMISAC